MVLIKVKKGFDLPLAGKAEGKVQKRDDTARVALDLMPFDALRFTLLKKEGEGVKRGEVVAVDKACGRAFVAPAAGKIVEVARGEKRRLLRVVIEKQGEECVRLDGTTLERWMKGGGFAHLRCRPGERLAQPDQKPRSIFIKALETAPFALASVLQVGGREEYLEAGLRELAKIAPVHFVTRPGDFLDVRHVQRHEVIGPDPASHPSVHIAHIDPIRSLSDLVWTASLQDVIVLGRLALEGIYENRRLISVAGEGMHQRGFFDVEAGCELNFAHTGRLISGDPLRGYESPFLGFYHTGVCAILEPTLHRQALHFVGLGLKRNTASRAYLPGLFRKKNWSMTTHQHGEERAFVDGAIYDRVMPLKLSTMHLVKALLNQDYTRAMELGLLEVESSDFALPTFICPSKIEMTTIVHEGLKEFASQYLS